MNLSEQRLAGRSDRERGVASGGTLLVDGGKAGGRVSLSPALALASPINPVGRAEAPRRSDLVDAYAHFIELLGPWDWYATLTFRESVHPEQAARLRAVVCAERAGAR